MTQIQKLDTILAEATEVVMQARIRIAELRGHAQADYSEESDLRLRDKMVMSQTKLQVTALKADVNNVFVKLSNLDLE